MLSVLTARRRLVLLALGIVVFAFWPSLLGGGSMFGADIVATAAPFDSYQPDAFSLENGPGDTINIHAHWASLADDVRSGDAGWWNPELAGGQPTMKGGLPVFNLPYLLVPDWYAPGLVAALRAFTAMALTFGLLRSWDLARTSALVGGVAFAFSGFMVGWMNWPHSSVAALAPGLLWAIERAIRDPRPWRAVPLGGVVALMAWANFPSVTLFLLLGAAVYALIRLQAEWRVAGVARANGRGLLVVGALAVVLAGLLAAPHIIGFGEYLDWTDTSHRVNTADDSSAGMTYLLTSIAPAIWGSDAVGAPWFGEGNWVEFNAHVGASVVLLAFVGFAGWHTGDRRRRSITLALAVVAGLGVMIAYVGGPIGGALGDIGGSRSGLATRAKVLWSLGMALAAALGVEQLVGPTHRRDLRRVLQATAVLLGLAALVMLPALKNWYDAIREIGEVRQTAAVSTMPILAALAVVGLIAARTRDVVSGRIAAWVLVGIVTVEVLAFAMPVPTTASADERLTATPAHEEVKALLGPGERLAGEGRTFFASTTQLFDIDDARGQLLKAPGYQALLREIDPEMLRKSGGGTPSNPNIADGTDPRSPVWDAMAVGVWAQFPDSTPIGTVLPPTDGAAGADPSVAPILGSTLVPEGGLRGVVVELAPFTSGTVEVEITTVDGTVAASRWIDVSEVGLAGFVVLGENLPVGSPVAVRVSAPADTMLATVIAQGALSVGVVAGDDDLELVRVGDVTLYERTVEPVAVVAEWVVEADPVAAAGHVAAGVTTLDAPGVAAPSGVASNVLAVDYGTDRVSIDLDGGGGGLLVVSQSHYPGWSATIDGEPAAIHVANAAFMGIEIPPGAESVELEFAPEHLGISLLSIVLGLALALSLLWVGRRSGHLRLRPSSAE